MYLDKDTRYYLKKQDLGQHIIYMPVDIHTNTQKEKEKAKKKRKEKWATQPSAE